MTTRETIENDVETVRASLKHNQLLKQKGYLRLIFCLFSKRSEESLDKIVIWL